MSVPVAVTIIVGTFVSGGTQVSNWTRFARSRRQAFVAALLAFLVGNGLMLFFGAVGAIAFGEADFVLVLYNLGLIVWGVIMLVGNIWTTNDNTAYAFSVAGAELTNHPSKRPFVVGGVAVGALLAVTGIYDGLITYLVWLGILIPPLGGVLIGDWWRRWRDGVPDRETYPVRGLRVALPGGLRGGRGSGLELGPARDRHPAGHRHPGGPRRGPGAQPARVTLSRAAIERPGACGSVRRHTRLLWR